MAQMATNSEIPRSSPRPESKNDITLTMAQMAERVATNSELQRLSPRPGSKLDRACNLLSGCTFGI